MTELVPPGHEVISLLGEGGMGRVYRARQVSLGREVALKVVREASNDLASRFERECRILSRLRHPGIVTLFEAGVVEGRRWLDPDRMAILEHAARERY